MCGFSSSLVVGYIAIVQYRDSSNPEDVGIGSTRDFGSYISVDGFANGSHCVTVFPLYENLELVYSQAVYKDVVKLSGFTDARPLPTSAILRKYVTRIELYMHKVSVILN